MRVLLVDDDPKFRAVVTMSVRHLNWELVQSGSLLEANSALSHSKFDLILLDGLLPDGDSLGWLREYRKFEPKIPVVYISAHLSKGASFNTLVKELEVSLVLQKPISAELMSDKLEALFKADSWGMDLEAMNELVAEYIADLPQTLSDLQVVLNQAQESFSQSNLKEAIRQAHTLRGNAGIFGFIELGVMMGQIEDLLRSISNDGSMNRWLEIERIFVACKFAVNNFLSQSSTGDERAPERRYPHVLLIDEDKSFSKRLRSLLSSEGILVYSFHDTEFAENVIEKTRPDLLILNRQISRYGGDDLLKVLHKSSRHRNFRIVALADGLESDGLESDEPLSASLSICATLNKAKNNIELIEDVKSLLKVGC
ncbi:MAG: response regulator [Candidatus Obscuribacterales bacterium]|nr:response regulator [Candidatus Obscuribacterales bacterium]